MTATEYHNHTIHTIVCCRLVNVSVLMNYQKQNNKQEKFSSKPFRALLLHYVRTYFRNILFPVQWWNSLVHCEWISKTKIIFANKMNYQHQTCTKEKNMEKKVDNLVSVELTAALDRSQRLRLLFSNFDLIVQLNVQQIPVEAAGFPFWQLTLKLQ